MRTSHILFLALLVLSSLSQTTSLSSFLKGSKSALPPNCSEQDQNNVCTKCSINYNLQNGVCAQKQAPITGTQNNEIIPCGKQESCGEAKNFKTEKDFEDFINKNAPQQQTGFVNGGIAGEVMPMVRQVQTVRAQPMMMAAESTVASAKSAPLPSVDANRDFSGTNNQVNGVDEADLLKTDGTYIYTISNSILSIILAYPASKARVVSQISLTDFTPSAIFIEGDYLAVFGTQWQYFGYDNTLQFAKMAFRPYGYSISYTFIKIYDVSNRGKPYLLKEFQVSGSYFNGRKLENGFMYLITTHDFYSIRRPWFDFGSGRRDVSASSIFWYPGVYQRVSAVNIISFNLGNPIRSSKKVSTICAEYTNIMYMSERYIYLTNYHYENGQEYTKIRKIYVRSSQIKPFADGKVRGTVNNQFSLDEYGQFLRIATTSNNGFGLTQNNIFVLNYFLSPYGELTGIAKGQRIFSARYTGRKCFLVTFRQVDPFFVISLKNHRKPEILGELKVPGFSRYLHIYDDDAVIGLGRQADANGRQLGLKISVFDVSDVFNPTESAKFELEEKYASSTAEWEHKAFLFSAERNLLVIPGYFYSNGLNFNGAFAFYISKTEITLRSAIDHILNSADNYYDRNVERSLYIEQLLYTKSKCLLRINKISQYFEGVKNINIPCQNILFNPPIIKPIPLPRPIIRAPPIIEDPVPIDPVPFEPVQLGSRSSTASTLTP